MGRCASEHRWKALKIPLIHSVLDCPLLCWLEAVQSGQTVQKVRNKIKIRVKGATMYICVNIFVSRATYHLSVSRLASRTGPDTAGEGTERSGWTVFRKTSLLTVSTQDLL